MLGPEQDEMTRLDICQKVMVAADYLPIPAQFKEQTKLQAQSLAQKEVASQEWLEKVLHNHLALRNYQDAALWPQCSLQFIVDRYQELYEVAKQVKDLQTSTFIQNMTEQHSLINIFNRIKNILTILNENIQSK